MKLANIDRESLHNFCKFWMTVNEISIKSSGKMWLMIILNVTKNQDFNFSLEDVGGGGVKFTPRVTFRVKLYIICAAPCLSPNFIYKYSKLLHFYMNFAVRLLITSYFSFWNQLYSLYVTLTIHETLSCNLYLCRHYADRICSLTFVVNYFSELFFNRSIFSTKHLRK